LVIPEIRHVTVRASDAGRVVTAEAKAPDARGRRPARGAEAMRRSYQYHYQYHCYYHYVIIIIIIIVIVIFICIVIPVFISRRGAASALSVSSLPKSSCGRGRLLSPRRLSSAARELLACPLDGGPGEGSDRRRGAGRGGSRSRGRRAAGPGTTAGVRSDLVAGGGFFAGRRGSARTPSGEPLAQSNF